MQKAIDLMIASLLVLLLWQPTSWMASGCVIYQSKFCGNVTQYYPVPQSLSGSGDLGYEIYDAALEGLGFSNLTFLGPLLFPACYELMLKYVCGSYFPGCDASQDEIPICLDICTNFVNQCTSILESQNLTSLIPNCTSEFTNDAGCTMLEDLPPLNYSDIECPGFLLNNIHPDLDLWNCPGACCIPCPASVYLYPEGVFFTGLAVVGAFNCICSVLCFSVGFVYLLIPAKRVYPNSLIIHLAFSVGLVLLTSWINVYVGSKETVCIDDIMEAAPGVDHPPCVAQGVIFFYGLWAACLWFFWICCNVFLIIFFRYDERRYAPWIAPAICWSIPWIPIGFLLGQKQIGVQFSPSCGVPDDTVANDAFFIPISFILFPSLFLTLIVCFKVYLLTRNTKKSFRSILKINSRPLVFSFLATSAFIAFWLYFEVAPENLTAWVEDWFLCVAFGGTQTECSKISTPYLPKMGLIVFIYLLLPFVGIVTFLLFGVKKDVGKGLLGLFGIRIFENFTDGYSVSQTHGSSKLSVKDTEEDVARKDKLKEMVNGRPANEVQLEQKQKELQKQLTAGEEERKADEIKQETGNEDLEKQGTRDDI